MVVAADTRSALLGDAAWHCTVKVMVTGVAGQVASSLRECSAAHPDLEISFVGRPHIDLAVVGSFASAIRLHEPDVVINAAAYTAVDRAEDEPELAVQINGTAAGEGAEAAKEIGARFIQVSTDYVFPGDAREPYREGDPTGPINAYGQSKLVGEQLVRSANPDHLIVRTSWIY